MSQDSPSLKGLKDLVQAMRERYPEFHQKLAQAEGQRSVAEFWSEAVGPQIAKHTEVVSIENGVLRIRVDHPAWRNEIYFRKNEILERLRITLAKSPGTFDVQDLEIWS